MTAFSGQFLNKSFHTRSSLGQCSSVVPVVRNGQLTGNKRNHSCVCSPDISVVTGFSLSVNYYLIHFQNPLNNPQQIYAKFNIFNLRRLLLIVVYCVWFSRENTLGIQKSSLQVSSVNLGNAILMPTFR